MNHLDILRQSLDDVAMPIHFVGPDGLIIWANRAELDLLGYTQEEYFGHPISHFHADPPTIDDILTKLQAGESLHEYPARLRCRDNTIKHVQINSNVHWENGEFIHTRCFTRDVTEHVRVEQLVFELSAPILEIDHQLLLLPLVGGLTRHRSKLITRELLDAVKRYRARAVVLDLTGTAEADAYVLEVLSNLCRACKGLGAHVVLSGISPELADKMVALQSAIQDFVAVARLRDGILRAQQLSSAAYTP